ncbi:potassium channel family protein [Streptomyces sp. B6B3]|uniref:potassium channel family protein n=1 Tax=Streptomyces sp. B6B3 TaxID=3153570 RepID=UPI00325E51DA
MFGFVVLAGVLVASARRAWKDRVFRGAALSLVLTVVTGTVFYRVHEGWSMLDSLYFSVTTGLTIGYGDLAPTTGFSKVFTMVYALSTVSLFVAVSGLLLESGEKGKTAGKTANRLRDRVTRHRGDGPGG